MAGHVCMGEGRTLRRMGGMVEDGESLRGGVLARQVWTFCWSGAGRWALFNCLEVSAVRLDVGLVHRSETTEHTSKIAKFSAQSLFQSHGRE